MSDGGRNQQEDDDAGRNGGVVRFRGSDGSMMNMGTPPGGMSPEQKADLARLNAERRLKERQLDLMRDYPGWAMNAGEAAAAKGHGQGGEWEADRGPPYVAAVTLYTGAVSSSVLLFSCLSQAVST